MPEKRNSEIEKKLASIETQVLDTRSAVYFILIMVGVLLALVFGAVLRIFFG